LVKTNLTEEEKAKIIEALNEHTEPSPDLMEKLFPSLAEKFDVAKLGWATVGAMEHDGKTSEASKSDSGLDTPDFTPKTPVTSFAICLVSG